MYVREQPMQRHYTPVPKVLQSATAPKTPVSYNPRAPQSAATTYQGGCGGCGKNKTISNEAKTL
jgi:hypothetical protein